MTCEAFRLGKDAKVYRNLVPYSTPTFTAAANEVKIARDVTQNLDKGDFDGSTRGTGGWRQHAGTLKDASIDLEILYRPSDVHYEALLAAFLFDGCVELLIVSGPPTVIGADGLWAEFTVTGFTRNEPLEEGLTVSVTLMPAISTNEPKWVKSNGAVFSVVTS